MDTQKRSGLKPYIGTKVIMAEKMSNSEFREKFRANQTHDLETEYCPGYHVQYSNPDGSKYDSWSPVHVFERSYREISEEELHWMGIRIPSQDNTQGPDTCSGEIRK